MRARRCMRCWRNGDFFQKSGWRIFIRMGHGSRDTRRTWVCREWRSPPARLGMDCQSLAGKNDVCGYRVFAMLSDGECDEGSTWEAALFAGHHRLDNLTAIIDYNKIQSLGTVKEVLDLEPLADKWSAFGWGVREIDGHDVAQIEETLASVPVEAGKPTCVVAHTVKGKGVSFMENKLLWHYRAPDQEEMSKAMAELGMEV